MDLRDFAQSKKEELKKEILINNNEVKISKLGDKIIFNFKKKESIQKFQEFLFFSPTESIISDNKEEALEFFKKSIKDGVEGLMFKKLSSAYIPGLRVGSMAKLKETKEDIDVVIIGAEHGKGKRAGFYSSFLVAIKDENSLTDEIKYLEIGKVSSGIKEKEDNNEGVTMEKLSNLLKPFKINEKEGLTLFEPKIIIQVRYQEIQKSNSYSSGYALRFPRIISLREDKSLDEINSLKDIISLSKM